MTVMRCFIYTVINILYPNVSLPFSYITKNIHIGNFLCFQFSKGVIDNGKKIFQ